MVFFTCSHCGTALKKNQVEKHYMQQCRSCQFVTCIDCNTDFWGNDYNGHTKCISEDQKYGGKNFTPKENSNKGEVKQEQWIEKVKETVANSKVPPKIANLMNQLLQFSNIPRKRVKFENFVSNSLRLRDQNLINQIWDLFSSGSQDNDESKSSNQTPSSTKRKFKEKSDGTQSDCQNGVKKQKCDGNYSNSNEHLSSKADPKFHLTETVENLLRQCPEAQISVQKSKKKKGNVEMNNCELEMSNNNENGSDTECVKKAKFKLTKTVKNILRQHPERQMSLKKLKKKVFKEYKAHIGEDIEKQSFLNKVEERINNYKKLHVVDNQVKLIE